RPAMPMGSAGFRWGQEKGKWNLLLKDGVSGAAIQPLLSFLDRADEIAQIELDDFGEGQTVARGVPAKRVALGDGSTVLVATVYDLLMAQYGVDRGLGGDYPKDYDDEQPFTPAWQEKYTGLSRDMLLKFAREWASTAEKTNGKCTVIIGAGINHWYHANLMYRAAIHALVFCGCIGVNGGGLAHYVGQEKLAPGEPWGAIAFGKDWHTASRQQNAPSWHYVHSDQWRYERSFTEYNKLPRDVAESTKGHTIDHQVRAVRRGWLPFYPQFNKSSIELVREAEKAGCKDDQEIIDYVVEQLKSRKLQFAVEDPDAPENWPRVWFIWRGNALLSSAKGHEYFLKHYLGTHTNTVAEDLAAGATKEVVWREKAPEGKMDLIVDLNFRMDTSALYSDVVLPAATFYEKADINSTDMHSFIHPLSMAVPPSWESKSDWQIFRALAKKFSEMAEKHFDGPVRDIVATALAHDSAAEIAQSEPKDWYTGECEAIPGKTMPGLKIVTRDYRDVYRQFISFGPESRKNGLGAHGTHYAIDDFYDSMLTTHPTVCWEHEGTDKPCSVIPSEAKDLAGAGPDPSPSSRLRMTCRRYPSLKEDEHAVNAVLHLATVTNGELAYRSYREMEAKVGLPLTHLAEKQRGVRVSFADLQAKPVRFVNSPMWSGLIENGRAYSPFTYNVECLVPWRTLTGRQHLYLDHPTYIEFGEHLPTYKPKPLPIEYADLRFSEKNTGAMMLNYLTPHGKWHIHSTYGDNQRMTTLSRGVEPFWMSEADAAAIGINDNDWVEVFNDHGVVVTRAAVSRRIPRGICIQYHAPERTYSVPKSPLRGNKRAGGHNSLTRTRLKPNLMIGGYGQFTFQFNYWGPTGSNRDTHVLVRKLTELNW
ncbi:MAG TPA: molybdopterin-dependent oxidoreductase, partial [Thermoanaerobaculia bacterium]|nr:molybdopterin-dependent oxidoreductase [Thermoanaerobaculia bacterium]